MRVIRLVSALVFLLALGVGVIHAEEEVMGVALFPDGRVNNWQIDAPVAIYCVFSGSEDTTAFERVEVWGLANQKLLEASAAQINAAEAATTLTSADGYSLSKLADGSLQVAAPNGYSFTWARGDTNC